MLTKEPLPPARSLAEGSADMITMLLASLFRARHGLAAAAADREGQMTQFAQWLEEYDVQVSSLLLGVLGGTSYCCHSISLLPYIVALPHMENSQGWYFSRPCRKRGHNVVVSAEPAQWLHL